MKCTVCGMENPNNARFCGFCGSPAPEINVNTDDTADTADLSTNINDVGSSEEYASDSISESSSEPLSESSHNDDGVTAPKPPSESDADTSVCDQPAASPAPTPVPTATQRSIFSNSGLGGSFDSQENAAVPQQNIARKNKKEKKMVSLSVAIICIIAVFILAVVCGILTQLYIRKSGGANHTGTVYSSDKTAEDKNGRHEYILSNDNEISVYCKGESNNG